MKSRFNVWLNEIITNRKAVERARKELDMMQDYARELHAANKRLKEHVASLEKEAKRLLSNNIVLQQQYEYAHTYNLAAAQTLGRIGGTLECGQELGKPL